jgi:hypothetical protein
MIPNSGNRFSEKHARRPILLDQAYLGSANPARAWHQVGGQDDGY